MTTLEDPDVTSEQAPLGERQAARRRSIGYFLLVIIMMAGWLYLLGWCA